MAEIHLTQELYEQARKACELHGFSSVDEYVASLVREGLSEGLSQKDIERMFTPEVIADLDRIAASIDAGAKMYTVPEVSAILEHKSQTWQKKQAS